MKTNEPFFSAAMPTEKRSGYEREQEGEAKRGRIGMALT